MNLTRFENNDGIEIYVNTSNGESFATVTGYAKMSGKSKSTIQSRVDRMTEGERFNNTKEAEIFIGGGLQGVRLINEQLICEWLPKDNPEMATKLMQLGVRSFLHTLAGYEVKSSAIKPKTALELAREQVKLLEHIEYLEAQKNQLEQEKTKLDKINNILVDKIEEDQPKVEFANDVWVTERNMTMGDYSKVIKWGRNKLFAKLRELGVIMPNSTLPYQRWIDAGYFEVTEVVKKETNKAFPFCTVTPKGQLWIHKKLSKVG